MAEELHWEESMLENLAHAVAFPPTPDLRAAVLARLEAPRPRSAWPSAWRFAAAGAAIALLVLIGVTALSRDVRDAVAGFLGLRVEGEQIELLPTPPAGTTPTPFPTPASGTLQFSTFAREVSRAEALASGVPLRLPQSLGEPARYWRMNSGPGLVIADYGDIQVWLMRYEGDYFIGKGIVGGGEVIHEVEVNGAPGYWVRGGERVVSVRSASGTVVAGTTRTVTAAALIWSEDGLYTRIEGAGSLEDALRLAAEMD